MLNFVCMVYKVEMLSGIVKLRKGFVVFMGVNLFLILLKLFIGERERNRKSLQN